MPASRFITLVSDIGRGDLVGVSPRAVSFFSSPTLALLRLNAEGANDCMCTKREVRGNLCGCSQYSRGRYVGLHTGEKEIFFFSCGKCVSVLFALFSRTS